MADRLKDYRELGDTVVLYPHNYINDIEGERLEEMANVFINKGVRKLVIDFSDTDLINSIGISILIGIMEKVRTSGGVMLFSGLKKVNRDIFNLVGLTRVIPVVPTEDEAVEKVEDLARAGSMW